jgi:hypothetical protein
MNPLLAQLTESQTRTVMVWGGAMILFCVAGFGAIMYLKKYMRTRGEARNDAGFSLSELKEMLYRGEITPEEYETTKAHVIAKVKGKLAGGGTVGRGKMPERRLKAEGGAPPAVPPESAPPGDTAPGENAGP